MKNYFKKNRILMVIALVGLIASLFPVAARVQAEEANKKYDLILGYSSLRAMAFGTGKVSDEKLEEAVSRVFDLRPTAIIRDLDLRKPIYRKLAAYGHMGREDLGVAWEKTDRVDALRAAIG